MDYLITMDTGEQFLAHHGVKGMKWGKWNSETAARYSGGNGERKKMSDSTKQKLKTAGKVAAVVGTAAAVGIGAKYGLDKITSNEKLANQVGNSITKLTPKAMELQAATQHKENLETIQKVYKKGSNITKNERALLNAVEKTGINRTNIEDQVKQAAVKSSQALKAYSEAKNSKEKISQGFDAIGKNSTRIGIGAGAATAALGGKMIVDRMKLRDRTLKTNDPKKVRKGMDLLSDSELKSKISRMELEGQVDRLYMQRESRKYELKGKQREARKKTFTYDMASRAGQQAINKVIGGGNNKKNKKNKNK